MAEKIELTVTGMSCGHCEATVKDALSKVEGVTRAEADHKASKAVVEAEEGRVSREALIAAVKGAGYEAS